MNTNTDSKTHQGSCHCGDVRFEVELDLATGGSRCNCTICTKLSPVGRSLKPAAFKLLTPEADLVTYVWGQVSTRYFCKRCFTYCFGRGHLEQLGGDFVSVNLNCLDGVDLSTLKVMHWDGRHNNWQAGMRDTPWPT